MKRLIALLFALVCISQINTSNSCSTDEDVYFIICRPGTVVNVRKTPNNHADVIGCKFFGDEVTVDREKNGFAHITNLNSEYTDGWVYKGLITEDKPSEANLTGYIKSNARVAGHKYVNGKIKRWLANGTEVMIYAISEEWCVTNKGYVKREFIEVWEPENGS